MKTTLMILVLVATSLNGIQASVDEFMSCDRLYASQRQSRVMEHIPCDMTSQSFCQHKGSAYPEAAIWRFKEENRALMRRLYGDLESSSLYREMRSTMSSESSGRPDYPELTLGSAFSSLEYNIRIGSGLATVQSAKEPLLLRNGSHGKIKIKRKIVKKKKKNDEEDEGSEEVAEEPDEEAGVGRQSNGENAGQPPDSKDAEETEEDATQNQVKVETSTTTSTSVVYAASSSTISETTTKLTNLMPTTVTTETVMTTNTVWPTESITDESMQPTTPESKNNLGASADEGKRDKNFSELLDEIEKVVHFSDPEADKVNYDNIKSKENNGEQHLPEDPDIFAVEEDQEAEYISDLEVDFNGPAVNACPVKEEVFAPYWANNTRNQVLALLNLYPFEQYIHMETCKHDKEQMLCRKGCRCEQQFRLHRLLAFDPNNECRGIFSDWFRFPSYCICKCYNIPPEFESRVRKPRLDSDDDNGSSSPPEVKLRPFMKKPFNSHYFLYDHDLMIRKNILPNNYNPT